MARSLFFDSVNEDRAYSAADYAALISTLVLRDGVVHGYRNALAVTPGLGLSVQVGTGASFVQGHLLDVYAAEALALEAADAANPRIDRIVVRLDTSALVRSVSLAVKTGVPAPVPAAPALQRDSTAWELSLAQVAVAAGASAIAEGDLTDERADPVICGFTTFSEVVAQFRAAAKSVIGAKTGLEIYCAGSDDLRIRPGFVHVNDDTTDHYVRAAAEVVLSGESGLVGWQFVTVDGAGTIRFQAATGTAAQRPTDACFQWANYDHVKGGYYFNATERIIGAVYRVAADTWYLVNVSEDGAESGRCSNGLWERTAGGRQEFALDVFTLSYFSDTTLRYTWVFPVAFAATDYIVDFSVTSPGPVSGRTAQELIGTKAVDSVILDRNGAASSYSAGNTQTGNAHAIGRYK